MSSNPIVNGAPMVGDLGTQDLSTTQLPREPEAIPQHLPKFYLYAQKGLPGAQLVVGEERNRIFGTETFNPRSKYFNHATVFANGVNAKANACMIERLVPADAGPEASIIGWLDVLPTTVDVYERNIDGSIKLDALGTPIITGTTAGYKVKWVVTHHASKAALQNFGALTITPGDQVDVLTSTQSQRYPIFEKIISSQGEYGNNTGIRLWAPTTKTVQALPTRLMATDKVYPYFISVIKRDTALATPKAVETVMAEQKLMVTFKRETIDPTTDRELSIETTLIDSYQNITDVRYPLQVGEFGKFNLYYQNLETLLGLFHAAEIPHIHADSDFGPSVEDKHLFNFVSGVSSTNVPYHSFVFVDSVNSVRLSEYTNVYAAGGSDGTMSDALHAALVSTAVKEYSNPNSQLQDLAYNVESIMYDSGFPLETKLDLIDFIAVRKDTAVVLGTHTVGERDLTASEELSIAIALRTRAQMYPESDYFGTPVMRALIMGRSGKIRNNQYKKHVPLTYEVAIKAAAYMGASNGAWKNQFSFGGAPGHVIETMTDINITWVPNAVRNRNWDVGLNWVARYDRGSYFIPALKTVYDNDTSVLNSFTNMMAICQLNKVAHAAWREFSGVDDLSNAQLVSRVNAFVVKRTINRFDNRFVITPKALVTDMDILRGFSWTLPIQIFAPNMKTHMTTYVQAKRLDALATTA